MPEFSYRGRDQEGRLRIGKRSAYSVDFLNNELIKEGISPIQINEVIVHQSFWSKLPRFSQNKGAHLQELATFARQMQLLHHAGVPLVTALKQLAHYTRSAQLSKTLRGVIVDIEKGENMANAMRNYPEVFTPLMINLIKIGENSGHLSESFGYLHRYIEFELKSIKQVKASLRYPTFVIISIVLAIITLNVFVIPTFAKFYQNVTANLPWQTQLLIDMSNFTMNYGVYLAILIAAMMTGLYMYFKTPTGKYRIDKAKLRIPFFGNLLKRIIMIRFSQLLSITQSSGLGVTQGLLLVKQAITNSFIVEQIAQTQESIERGVSFTQAITKIELFSPLELQILSVGEKNGELSSSLDYISDFHTREIEFDLKRMSDLIGPILISAVAGLILIIALGVYLPIWDMVNLPH